MKRVTVILFFSLTSFSACSFQRTENLSEVPATKIETNLNSQKTEVIVKKAGEIKTDSAIPVVKPSNIIAELRKKKSDDPKISAKELSAYGNELLKTTGYDFTFDWEPKGKENDENLSKLNFDKYYPFKYQFTDVAGERKLFQLMNNNFSSPCYSVIDVPITKVTEQTMTVIADDKAVEVKKPKDFYSEEFALVDESFKKTFRKWKTPIDAIPLGISEDGKKVYFDSWEFAQNEIEGFRESPLNLAVEISEDGSLRLVDAKDIKSDEGVQIDYDKKHTEIIYEKYKVGNKEYIIKYSAPCT